MKMIAKEGQVVIAGRVGSIKPVAHGKMLEVSVKVGRGQEDWATVTLSDKKDGSAGNKTTFERFGEVGQHVTFLCNEVKNAEYTNLYAVALDLGPKAHKQEQK